VPTVGGDRRRAVDATQASGLIHSSTRSMNAFIAAGDESRVGEQRRELGVEYAAGIVHEAHDVNKFTL
jgi:hypothetical protein